MSTTTLGDSSNLLELSQDEHTNLADMLYSNWVWRAVHALMSHKDFDSSIPWLVKQLKVSFEEVVEALEGLEKLGLVSKKSGAYHAEPWRELIPEIAPTLERRLESHKITSAQIINQIDESDRFSFYDCIYFSNRKLTTELYAQIRDLIEKWEKKSEQADTSDGVWALTYTATRMTPEIKD